MSCAICWAIRMPRSNDWRRKRSAGSHSALGAILEQLSIERTLFSIDDTAPCSMMAALQGRAIRAQRESHVMQRM
jgi:hypothetical protein